ncbi:hypothetical protein AMK59_6485 [Oryctes borbonicus]|uniref:Methyltransferase n=1 Tax=Oryctes borbonicus TaxID=1629725 RepID=A0A0T6AYT7_9SCAR|nr:hypothetical protein AMK59_6485 [Oryctes borbonicus]
MENEFKNLVISLHKQNKWKEILDLDINSHKQEVVRNLLWIWPSIDNMNFLKRLIIENDLNGLASVGCGCGLLEWMFREFSDMNVLGYEINKEWWTSKYSIPMFIDLIYCNQETKPKLNPKYALLFCYFNDGEAFRKYIRSYSGNLVFIIGPGEGKGTHTEPRPFKPGFENNNWMLHDYQEVKDTKDFIAAYIRK